MPAAEWAQVALTEDLRNEATAMAGVARLMREESRRWKHPAWGERLRLAADDCQQIAEGTLMVADEGDFWRMRNHLQTVQEERAAASLILRRAVRNRQQLFMPTPPEVIGLLA